MPEHDFPHSLYNNFKQRKVKGQVILHEFIYVGVDNSYPHLFAVPIK
jgi:hypothetical protein